MEGTFNIGDVVILNSNPELSMTVDFVLGQKPANKAEAVFAYQMKINGFEDGDVNCTWFEGTTVKDGTFKAKTLTKKK